MNLIFKTLNKPATNTQASKVVYDGYETAFQKSIKEDLSKVKDKLEGLEITVTLDFEKGIGSFSGDIPDDKMEIIKEATKQK
ncbi:Uncharacterised protein [Chryseobacterium nakagawai]|uniref:Uncharacterized protein n=1 Tax=Chryseobacterium nakagawai TaxID=1241982 RepID=A0AAD0YLL7_CHRNA|nr:hypothetical protein [Chryseobacterium nakagawai]AZA91154.1 hypothetical protein EG343_11185 [Chryseobacterium nakagawai]VEH22715.1 Uncharacterised protein [Chryseobacterium nakagawai]